MSKKKMVMSVTASAAIAAAIFGAEEAEASSYKVQPGDTLWSISQKSGTSVSELRSINGLSSDIIYPNQVINTSTSSSSTSVSVSTQASTSQASSVNVASTSGNTYTVKRGDTLSKIAKQHNISLQNLMSWNNLDTTLIYPGNKLVVSKSSSGGSAPASSSSSSSASASQTSTGSASVYTVKSGDTLFGVASRHGVGVADLKKWNNLNSDTIYIGQKLNINGSSSPSSVNAGSGSSSSGSKTVSVDYNVDRLVSVARNQTGVPYAWAGTTPSGFDCSGFIYYAYNQAGKNIDRLSTSGYYNRSYHVNTPQVGDLVFFSGTYRSGISHMGIYVGNNQFIHAGTSTGVTVTSLDNSYWKKHFDSFKRFY